MAKFDTLKEDFSTNYDEAQYYRSNATQVVIADKVLTLTSLLAGNYVGLGTDNVFDLSDSYVFLRVRDAGNYAEVGMASWEAYPIQINLDGSNALLFLIGYSTLYAIKRVAGSNTNLATVTFDPAVHKWLRIRESGGTVYWEHSVDGSTWNSFASELVSNLFTITALNLEINVGTWQAESITSTMVIDNLNIESGSKPYNYPTIKVGNGMSRSEGAT